MPIKSTPAPPNLTSQQSFTKDTGFTRTPAPSLAPTPQVAGLIPNDILLAVDTNVISHPSPSITGGQAKTLVINVPFSNLPSIQCAQSEIPILLVTAFVSHSVLHLVVEGYDAVGVATAPPANLTGPIFAAASKLVAYAAQVTVRLGTDAYQPAAGSLIVRASAQLIIRRTSQTSQ